MDFEWRLPEKYGDAPLPASPPEEDNDPYGLNQLLEGWQRPAIGRVRPDVDTSSLSPGKFVVMKADEDDNYTFEVEGVKLWLGRVRVAI